MQKYAPGKLELAPRDVVSRSMIREIQEGRGDSSMRPVSIALNSTLRTLGLSA